MQQVTELVEDRLNLVVREQRRLAVGRGREIAADIAEVRRARAIVLRTSGNEITHPRPAAFRLTRMPVGIKRTQMPALRVAQVVEFNLVMPHLHRAGCTFGDAQTENAAREIKHARDHPVHWQIWPQHFVVEIVALLAKFLRPIADLPRFQHRARRTRFPRLELLQLRALALERSLRATAHVLNESQRAFAGPSHATREHQIREMRFAEEARLLVA